MTEREKIINIVEQNKYCDVNTAANCRECKYSKELENYKDMGCSSLKTADALIAAGMGDVSAQKAEQEEIKLFNAEIKNGEIDMTVGGAGFKTFFALVEQIFKQNGASAFLTTTIEGGNDIKYAVTIQRVGEKSPAEELRQATELWKYEKHRAEVAEKECNEWKERAERMHKEALKQKQRVSDSKHSEDTMRNQLECAMGMASEMEYAKRALEILYMSGAITEEALRDAEKQAKLEIEEEEADDR